MREAIGERDRALLLSADRVVGVDEVGRGCLAGPVVVGGVSFASIPHNPMVQDSKTLTDAQRRKAAAWVRAHCTDWVVVEIWPELIDRINILQAVRLAMRSVIDVMADGSSVAVVDQVDVDRAPCRVVSEPRADSAYFTVAAASVVAKVHRDDLMVELDRRLPLWGWSGNKGYATRKHRRALSEHGPSHLHRRTFTWSPVLP